MFLGASGVLPSVDLTVVCVVDARLPSLLGLREFGYDVRVCGQGDLARRSSKDTLGRLCDRDLDRLLTKERFLGDWVRYPGDLVPDLDREYLGDCLRSRNGDLPRPKPGDGRLSL